MSDAANVPIRVNSDEVTLRPLFGKIIVILIWVICAIAFGTLFVGFSASNLRYVPLIAFAAYGIWILFWSPSVTIGPAGVTVRNLLRSHEISWPAIQRVDTKYALTLYTTAAKIVAWSAPQPGRFEALRTAQADIEFLPESTYGAGGGIRPGDLPKSASGLAALYVRRYWEQLRDAGHLDSGVVEGTGVVTRWLRRETVTLCGLLVVAVLCATLIP